MSQKLFLLALSLACAHAAVQPFQIPSCNRAIHSPSSSSTSQRYGPSTVNNDIMKLETVTLTLTTTTLITTAPYHTLSNPTTTHYVDVGARGDLIFSPDQVRASVGDIIRFNFLGQNHTVTRSSFEKPCFPSGQFDTGFNQFNPSNTSNLLYVDYRVDDYQPQWFYCKQSAPSSHCSAGMLFAINAGDKFYEFSENAKMQGKSDAGKFDRPYYPNNSWRSI